MSTPSGIVRLRVAGLFSFKGGLDFGGYGLASMALADARTVMDKPNLWDEIDVTVKSGASIEAVRKELDATLGPRRRGRHTGDQGRGGAEADRRAGCGPLLLLRHRLVRRRVPDPELVQHDRAAAHPRDRTLRALGATDRRIVRAVLVEALVLGSSAPSWASRWARGWRCC
jgi:hypothetical protein